MWGDKGREEKPKERVKRERKEAERAAREEKTDPRSGSGSPIPLISRTQNV